MLRAVGADHQRDDHTVLADVDTVEQETDQIPTGGGKTLLATKIIDLVNVHY